ncbi:MAG: hypothetical protein AAGA36_10695 [Pseudomonadota bacterium]
MVKRVVIMAVLAMVSGPAWAADITVKMSNQKGVPVEGAVVTFHPETGAPLSAEDAAASITVNQKDNNFLPFISVVPREASVKFLNEDSVLHHVFSFSAAKRFSLKLFGKGEPQEVVFDDPGVVVVGCNIHDQMIAYLKIVETPHAGKTEDDGMVTLTNVPDSPGELRIWHPLMKGRGNELRVAVDPTTTSDVLAFERKFRRGARPTGDY